MKRGDTVRVYPIGHHHEAAERLWRIFSRHGTGSRRN
jgi:hypothetical protein